MRNRILLTLALCLVSQVTFGASSYVGKVKRIVSPTIIEVSLSDEEFITLNILGLKKNGEQHCGEAKGVNGKACNAMKAWLDGKSLGVIIEKVDGKAMYGDIVVGDKLISQEIVRHGYYAVDSTKSMSHYLFQAELEAYCNYRGIHAVNKGMHEVAEKCARR